MIPILYPSDEIAFDNNGLGRLYDIISCEVTEERNGVYECDFDYPVTGAHFGDILLGRIIAVEHDDTNDVQPFDIVSYSRPIDGVVTFHAQHISYRLSKMVITGSSIYSLADAFTKFADASPSMPFRFYTDKTSTGYLACFDGIPKSVRECMGGVEGSLLDAYGGEYKFDKFSVFLLNQRGVDRAMSIRYGLNLTEYDEETDYSESYTGCIAYWSGQDDSGNDVIVKTDLVTASLTSYNGRNEVVALDLTDKFEDIPTIAQLTNSAKSYMASNQVNLPNQNISVDFVNLKDTLEYRDYANLWKCNLCDTINVIFPKYGMKGRFKIVRTVYDVLQERFSSMELGNLSTTLSEALGISVSSDVASTPSSYSQKGSTNIVPGYISTSKTAVQFSYVLPFKIDVDATVTIKNLTMVFRGMTTDTTPTFVYVGPTASTSTDPRTIVSNGTLNSNIASANVYVTTPNVLLVSVTHNDEWKPSSGTLVNNQNLAIRIGAFDINIS